MVEDENATNESNNNSGDEGLVGGSNTAGAMRRTIEQDNYASKMGQGFGRRKSSQNSHLSKGSGQNSKKGSTKSGAIVNNFFQQHPIQNPVVQSVVKQQGWTQNKLAKLNPVLDSRKNAKGTSGTRMRARKPSGEPNQANI